MFILKFLGRCFLSLIRMLIVGGGVFALVALTIDKYLKPEYGITNLYIIIGSLSFLPMFTALFMEFYLRQLRKSKKVKKMEKGAYLKESTKNNPLPM